MTSASNDYHSVALKREYPLKPLEYVPCPLCSARDDFVLATKGFPNDIPVRNVICKGCGLVRIDPRMTREHYELFYKEDFFDYLNPMDRPGYVAEIEHTTDDAYETPTKKNLLPYLLPWVTQGGRVLDIGAGFGQILYLLKKEKNIEGVGLEPDPYSRAVAKEKMGIELLDATVETFCESDHGLFDLIVMDQTFEHLLTPLQTLQALARMLTPEGIIFISVPGTYNPAISMSLFYQIAHTYNYTPHTLRLFAQQSGLKVISVRDNGGYPLEVILARGDAQYPEEAAERMAPGSDWRDVVRRLKRKSRLNAWRGGAKRFLRNVVGERMTERLRRLLDGITGYRY
jgi:2-polyprenyl-3-methyl-5-hydroxy-6-metoxy-1,4-benzoquinol methylase